MKYVLLVLITGIIICQLFNLALSILYHINDKRRAKRKIPEETEYMLINNIIITIDDEYLF